ncbi:MAG: SEC-C domain-containing protein [Butyrivibrio sp.]|nr:SEC-C domain-containing protein [Butyrivibrio sp.]
MGILGQWHAMAYSEKTPKNELQALWTEYFQKEKEIYATLLKDPGTSAAITGTVRELADRFGVDLMTMTGFLDGINDSLKEPNPIDEMEEDTQVQLGFDLEKLYKNMVLAGADWLYNLPEWESIYDAERRAVLFKEAKDSQTVRKEARIYPNDPCPCGSGKKYKKCCGRNVA